MRFNTKQLAKAIAHEIEILNRLDEAKEQAELTAQADEIIDTIKTLQLAVAVLKLKQQQLP